VPTRTFVHSGLALTAVLAAGALACDPTESPVAPEAASVRASQAESRQAEVYIAKLRPLNTEVSFRRVTGTAVVKVKGGAQLGPPTDLQPFGGFGDRA